MPSSTPPPASALICGLHSFCCCSLRRPSPLATLPDHRPCPPETREAVFLDSPLTTHLAHEAFQRSFRRRAQLQVVLPLQLQPQQLAGVGAGEVGEEDALAEAAAQAGVGRQQLVNLRTGQQGGVTSVRVRRGQQQQGVVIAWCLVFSAGCHCWFDGEDLHDNPGADFLTGRPGRPPPPLSPSSPPPPPPPALQLMLNSSRCGEVTCAS